MHRIRRSAVAALVAAALMAACTSQTDDDDSSSAPTSGGRAGTEQPANVVGLSDSTITVSMIAADLSLLSKQNLAPEIGDAAKTARAVVDDINANGGVAGRKLKLVAHTVDGTQVQLDPDVGRQICVQATEDDKPFAVFITAAITAEAVQCTAIDHPVLTISMDSWPKSYYDRAKGRLFSLGSHISVERDREYEAWPKILQDAGYLDGKTVGIIRTDAPDQQEAVDDALKPGLDAIGVKVAAEAVLPCPEASQTCEQHDVAIQRMKDAKVDFVFLVAQNLSGAAVAEAAQKVGYRPQWTTTGNNVTNTVARFFANAKETWDGAIGLDTQFKDFTDTAQECNDIAVKGGAEKFPKGSDGYGFTAVTCIQIQALADAIDAVEGPITQATVIDALERLDPVPMQSGPAGTLSNEKHDAGNSAFLSKYSAGSQVFEPVDGRKPIPLEK
jgi:ABC-type branched-subunit amino acid transport system substrate-binding protein